MEDEEEGDFNYKNNVIILNADDYKDRVSPCTCCVFYLLAHLTD